MTKEWQDWTKDELLKLPTRDWTATSTYDCVLLVNTKKKHDSGFNLFAVIGCELDGNSCVPVEIAGYMDDFRLRADSWCADSIVLQPECIAFDCSMHGVFRLWSWYYNIKIHDSLSTTQFSFVGKRKVK